MRGTAKIDYFTKNLSSPTFFEITTSKFQEKFLSLNIFRKFYSKEFFLIIKKKNFYKK